MIAGSWRGKNILQRNAIIALANSNDRSAIPKLLEIIDKKQNPVHMATAIWALGQLVKHPNDEMVSFIAGISSDNDDVIAEQMAFLNMVKDLQM
ncbi:4Fe-4S ferredoxin [Streptococcus suis]|nr:4Fe-4S ferredoxin [Streptococcus suis]